MYLFFVRHFNDIDHIVPIVWKMKKDRYPVAVYCINPKYDIEADYRLRYLKKMGVTVDYIYNNFDTKLGWPQRLLRFFFTGIFSLNNKFDSNRPGHNPNLSAIARWLMEKIGFQIYRLARRLYYDQNWARHVIVVSTAKALCFDHIKPKLYVLDVLLKAAKELSVPTLALPHGIYLYTNEFVKIRPKPMERSDKFNRFNYIVVQNQLRKEVLTKAGVHADKIVVLGSARYCSEWMKQNNQIMPYRLSPHKGPAKKLKVVFMTSKPQCRMDISRMKDTLTMLSKMENTEVLIKPHTRIGEEGPIFKDLQLPLATKVLSAELCQWADVVLVVASSIITEVLVRGKPALYLKYLHENTTLFEELNACWTIHDESELNQALQVLQSQKAALPYAARDVDNFLSENIFGGKDEKDVLADYEKFIVNCAIH
jgi:hypothetical protein